MRLVSKLIQSKIHSNSHRINGFAPNAIEYEVDYDIRQNSHRI